MQLHLYNFLHDFIIEKHVKQALIEDIGFGDITTDFIYDRNNQVKACLNSREEGILCGIDAVRIVFKILDPTIQIEFKLKDGDRLSVGQNIAVITGNCRVILTGERTALNYIQRMSAIATLTGKFQEAIKPYKARVVDTRKTTPCFRMFEKYAVKVGGGGLHRFNLSDCVMLKDNHISYCGGISEAVRKVRENISHTHKIEVETDTLEQVKEACAVGVDIIMLDNMTIAQMREAVILINHSAVVEASGNVTLDNINEIASTGVDIISTSVLQSKAGTLDIGLDI